MTITVKLFAQLRSAAGTGQLSLELPNDATAADAAAKLRQTHPGLETKGSMVAINAAYAEPGTVLRDGDVLALLPPVAGG
ncbi:MAG TPA: MoaD/ThiS family protein [Trueperaceae bacterium]|nr:MoaD/ThiS family protein [Trueperaceae bacterium]